MAAKKTKNKPKPKKAQERRLNEQQIIFCEKYLAQLGAGGTPNATQAARDAGYSLKGVEVTAHRLMHSSHVQEYISERFRERLEKYKSESNGPIDNIIKLSTANILDYVEWKNGKLKLKDSKKLTRDQGYSIMEISERKTQRFGSTINFKLHDKTKSNEIWARHLGLFAKDNDQKNLGGAIAEVLEEIAGCTRGLPRSSKTLRNPKR